MLSFDQLAAKSLYVAANLFARPTGQILNYYYSCFQDAYRMEANGDARVIAMAEAIRFHVGGASSILDVSCHEGYGLAFLVRELGAEAAIGLDLSEVALERARNRLTDVASTLICFDLQRLYRHPDVGLPSLPCDVVIVSETLYYLGLHWRIAGLRKDRKVRMMGALQRHAKKAVVLQHFGRDVRSPIGSVIADCGGHLVNEEWGIYILPGHAESVIQQC